MSIAQLVKTTIILFTILVIGVGACAGVKALGRAIDGLNATASHGVNL